MKSVRKHFSDDAIVQLDLELPDELIVPDDLVDNDARIADVITYHKKVVRVEGNSRLLENLCHYRRGKMYAQLQAYYPGHWKEFCVGTLKLSYLTVLRHIDFFKLCEGSLSTSLELTTV